VAPTATVLEGGVRRDRALGSETGRRTDHVPLRTLSQEAVTVTFFPHHVRPSSFRSRLPFLFTVLYHTPRLSFTVVAFVSPRLRLAVLSAPPIPTSPLLPRNADQGHQAP
jgi:hypothetical protein